MQGYDQHFKKMRKKRKGNPVVKRSISKTTLKGKTSEEALKELLIERRQLAKVKKNKRPIVDRTSILVTFGFVLTMTCFMFLDDIIKFVDKVQIKPMATASAAGTKDSAKKGSAKGTNKAENTSAKGTADTKLEEKNENWTREDLNYFSKLRDRKRNLDQREKELNKLEEELHYQKKEIEKRIGKLEEVRREIASVLKEKVQVDEKKVNKLVSFYSNMKPKQAADIITTINEDLAVEVLGKMKKKDAAAILNLLTPKKARTLSEKFAGYQRR